MTRAALLAQLRAEIQAVEGRPLQLAGAPTAHWRWGTSESAPESGLSSVEMALGGLHEVVPRQPAHWASAAAIAVRLLQRLPPTHQGRPLLWVQSQQTARERGRLSAAWLAASGLALEQLIFLDVSKPQDALWALEEGVGTAALGAVVAAGIDIGFTASRRLSLICAATAVPLLHLPETAAPTTAACTRWQVAPCASAADPLLPGAAGHPRWQLTLLRARQDSGLAWPATFEVGWTDAADGFVEIPLIHSFVNSARHAA